MRGIIGACLWRRTCFFTAGAEEGEDGRGGSVAHGAAQPPEARAEVVAVEGRVVVHRLVTGRHGRAGRQAGVRGAEERMDTT